MLGTRPIITLRGGVGPSLFGEMVVPRPVNNVNHYMLTSDDPLDIERLRIVLLNMFGYNILKKRAFRVYKVLNLAGALNEETLGDFTPEQLNAVNVNSIRDKLRLINKQISSLVTEFKVQYIEYVNLGYPVDISLEKAKEHAFSFFKLK